MHGSIMDQHNNDDHDVKAVLVDTDDDTETQAKAFQFFEDTFDMTKSIQDEWKQGNVPMYDVVCR